MNYSIPHLLTLPDAILLEEIFPQLSLEHLSQLCASNSRFKQICANERLWELRTDREFPMRFDDKPMNMSWRDYYKYWHKNQTKHRIYFGDVTHEKNPEWEVFEADFDLDDIVETLQRDYIDEFQIHENYYPNELGLYTDGINKFVVCDLYKRFEIWCLDEPDMSYNDMHNKYKLAQKSKSLSRLDPAELTYDEFKKYCELICTEGEYGHIYLWIQVWDRDRKEWRDVFR